MSKQRDFTDRLSGLRLLYDAHTPTVRHFSLNLTQTLNCVLARSTGCTDELGSSLTAPALIPRV